MNIQSARIMTDQEKTSYFQSIKSRYDKRVDDSCDLIINNAELFLKLYHQKDEEIGNIMFNHRRNQGIKIKAFNTKTCYKCGAKMRYITGYEFWGCPNYRDISDGEKHATFTEANPPQFFDIMADAKSWLTHIIADSGLKGKVMATHLFNFYMNEGFEDLREKYNGISTEVMLETYNKVRENSNAYEKKCVEELKLKFNKVLPQVGIQYFFQGDVKARYCFLDIVASNEKTVNIFECKTSQSDTNEVQRDLYENLMLFILTKNKDKRILTFTYLIQNKS